MTNDIVSFEPSDIFSESEDEEEEDIDMVEAVEKPGQGEKKVSTVITENIPIKPTVHEVHVFEYI